jgi:muramoyltetrapeptide carboxypeptidase
MIYPDHLKPGDTIGIAATARKVSPEEMDPAIAIIESWGYRVVLAKNIYAADNQFAGTDKERAAGIQNLLDDPNVKAILFARGGYGTVRIIDLLFFTGFKKKPKWIAGFSDITVLHSLLQKEGIASIHSPMAINMVSGQSHSSHERSIEELRLLLSGETITYGMKPHALNRKGEGSGILTGGNLSVLYSLLASPSETSTEDKILFLEDLDEYLYHIDRMMMALKRAGRLDKLAGLVVGGMNDMKDNTVPFGRNAEEIILNAVKEYNYPVCFGFPAGHQQENTPFILGRKVYLKVFADNVILLP